MSVMKRKGFLLSALCCAIFSFVFLSSANGRCAEINEVETEKIAVDLVRDVQKGGYGIVRTDELKQWMDQKKDVLVICTSPEEGYKKGHYPGAVNFAFPIPELKDMGEEEKAAFVKVLGPEKDRVLVFYCGFTKCTRSHNGAMWAKKLGYHNAYRCPGGINGWISAGFPVEKAD